MSQVGDSFRIPQFITARTKELLVRAMLLNNLQNGMEFNYFDIQKDGASWVVWFRHPIDRRKFIMENMDIG